MKPIDPKEFDTDRMLKNLQGNTLKGHGRDNTTHIFLSFKKEKIAEAKKWLRRFAEDNVTSLKKQLEERDAFKAPEKKEGSMFAGFFLTAEGYRTLEQKDVENKFKDKAFLAGMRQRRDETNDPHTEQWKEGFRDHIHAMILLADDDLTRMGNFTKSLIDTLDDFSLINVVEYGTAILNSEEQGIEHFGYVDGTSQPLFLKDEIEKYETVHNIKFSSDPHNNIKFDPRADKELILIPDPYMEQRDDKPILYGSYFVFRKLEQNVRAFKEAEKEVGVLLFPNDGDEFRRELAGAYLVGRFEDGSPVVMDDEDGIPNSSAFNNFDYSKDPSGGRCPHFAHVKMTNGRDGQKYQHQRMARRGIPFGHRSVNTELDPIPAQTPEGGVGLLFMSYQRSIEEQFEALQKVANTPVSGAIDPIIGQLAPTERPGPGNVKRNYQLPKTYGKNDEKLHAQFEQFVTMKGGEYFFAPSMVFLKSIM